MTTYEKLGYTRKYEQPIPKLTLLKAGITLLLAAGLLAYFLAFKWGRFL